MQKEIIKAGLLGSFLFLNNQEIFSQSKQKAYRFSIAKEAIALPTNNPFVGPIHPAVSVGIDYNIKTNNNWQRTLGVDFGFFHQRLSENALMLDATYTKGYKIGRFQPKFLAAVGYKHSLPAAEVYNYMDGEYKKTTFWGKSQFNTKVGFGLEYAMSQHYSILADYKFMVAIPYSERLPFSLHSFLGMGIKINISGKN